jgi:Zn-dependent protease with chaperone function
MSESWAATRFDGRSASGDVVLLRIVGDTLEIMSRNTLELVPLAQVAVGEAFEHAPRMLGLPGGRTLEVPDAQRSLPAALAAAGKRPSWIVRAQRAWPAAVIALGMLVAAGLWTYVVGLPIAARHVAHALPADFERRIGENVLELLDANRLEASHLAPERRARIEDRFQKAAALAAPGVEVRVEFRAGPVNAFALPGGIIVVFDELVERAGDDDRVLGVLGHELGHVVHRHSTRQLLQSLGLAAIAGLVWGDFSSIASNVPLILGVMRYGRAFEHEADDFAVAFLRANNLSPRPLYEFFLRIQGLEERRRPGQIPDFLSTHPDPYTRVERMRREVEAYEAAKRTQLR